jgi:hypothetical protein
MNGAIMQRALGFVIATFAFSSLSGAPADARIATAPTAASIDVTALLAAAHGAPPVICSLASRAISGYGWGNATDAPATPLRATGFDLTNDGDFGRAPLPAADVQRLLAGLSSDDACVREMSVRLLGTQKAEVVGNDLITRLASPEASLRSIAALGLGLVQATAGVDPLVRTLRDADVDVRANSAWALGRLENGRALNPLVALFTTTPKWCARRPWRRLVTWSRRAPYPH